MAGNSLVGFPIVGAHYPTEIWGDDIEELVELRQEYKHDDGDVDKAEIIELLDEEIRPRVNQKFIENLNYTVETEIETREEFDEVVESFPNESFYPTSRRCRFDVPTVRASPTTTKSISKAWGSRPTERARTSTFRVVSWS